MHIYKNANGMGVDICDKALEVARENANHLGLQARTKFVRSCWGEGALGEGEQFDIVISNPPYIPTQAIEMLAPEVRCFEPMLALDGGADGLNCYRAIIPKLPGLLAENGFAVFEIGMGQQRDLEEIATSNGLKVAGIKDDIAGIPRCVVITK